jgi:N-acetyl-alpha-D-glucosaminyl L-malate synthase BshA
MNIGITCFPTFGGSGIIATEIGLGLARRGHRVHFLCTGQPWRFDHFVENVFFHQVEARDYPLFDQSPYTLALTSKMVEVAQWERLDLMHVHYAIPHAASAYLARQILGEAAPKLVTTLHGTDITVVGNDPSFLPVTRFAIAASDSVTTPSQFLRDATRENMNLPELAVDVIPNFVDTDSFSPGPRAPGPRRIVHNSNFRPLKRVDDVIRVFAEVRRTTECELLLIGDGPERTRIERVVHDLGLSPSVRFYGMQLGFVEVLRASDVFLLTSQTESFGLAALEGLACGVPVVATRVGGLPEVVREGETGFLRDVGDIASMAQAVRRLLEDGALRRRMGEAARDDALTRFRKQPILEQWEALLGRVQAAS